ncbi:MAG: hypothetical protein LC105_05395 [Chitinophagales bacterium]|nr:hypothetical protein [Chitinophagales bacterium]
MAVNDIKIGRLKLSHAKAINRKCADIFIADRYIRHIANNHKNELAKLGFGVLEYVRLITSNYNQIRQGSEDSILLFIYTDKHLHHVAAISLIFDTKKSVWEIKTAQPRHTKNIEKKKILWQKLSKF